MNYNSIFIKYKGYKHNLKSLLIQIHNSFINKELNKSNIVNKIIFKNQNFFLKSKLIFQYKIKNWNSKYSFKLLVSIYQQHLYSLLNKYSINLWVING